MMPAGRPTVPAGRTAGAAAPGCPPGTGRPGHRPPGRGPIRAPRRDPCPGGTSTTPGPGRRYRGHHQLILRRHAQHHTRQGKLPPPHRGRAADVDRIVPGDLDMPGHDQVAPLGEERPALVEDLDPRVVPVGHVEPSPRVDRDRVRQAELPRTRPQIAPRVHISAIGVEMDDPVVPVSVADEQVALRRDRQVGRLIEVSVVVPGRSGCAEGQQRLPLGRELAHDVRRRRRPPRRSPAGRARSGGGGETGPGPTPGAIDPRGRRPAQARRPGRATKSGPACRRRRPRPRPRGVGAAGAATRHRPRSRRPGRCVDIAPARRPSRSPSGRTPARPRGPRRSSGAAARVFDAHSEREGVGAEGPPVRGTVLLRSLLGVPIET